MGWFGRKQKIEVDPLLGHPLIRRGLAAFKQRDWLTLRELYDAQSPSDAYTFVGMLGLLTELDEHMVELGESATALILQAGIRMGWASRHRGPSVASMVTESGVIGMVSNSISAYDQLLQAAQLRPECSVIAAFRLAALIYLDGDREELAYAQDQFSASTAPRCWFYGYNHVTFETPKWHGSMDDMWQTAHIYADRPDNAAWIALLAKAHIEEWLYTVSMDDDKEAKKAYSDKRYSQAFRDELVALDTRFWDHYGDVAMSHIEAVQAHNLMAFMHWRLGSKAQIGRHLDKIGTAMTEMPWGYLVREGQAAKMLARLRKQAGLGALESG